MSGCIHGAIVFNLASKDAVLRFTLDSASEFLFGSCVDSLSDDLPYSPMLPSPPPAPATTEKTLSSEFSRTFPAAFINAQQRTSERGWRSWAWPLFEIFGDRTKASMKIVDEHIEPIVREAIRKHQERGQGDGEKEDDEEETLLDNLVKQSSGMCVSCLYRELHADHVLQIPSC